MIRDSFQTGEGLLLNMNLTMYGTDRNDNQRILWSKLDGMEYVVLQQMSKKVRKSEKGSGA
jgi:hypothetical protein